MLRNIYRRHRLRAAEFDEPPSRLIQDGFAQNKIVDIELTDDGTAILIAENGERLEFDRVVIATGHGPGKKPGFLKTIEDSDAFTASPWGSEGRASLKRAAEMPNSRKRKILVVGTGLSGVDVHNYLRKDGFKGQIDMRSRGGHSHRTYDRNEDRPRQNELFEFSSPRFLNANSVEEGVMLMMEEYAYHRQTYSSEEILANWERHVPAIIERVKMLDRKNAATQTQQRDDVFRRDFEYNRNIFGDSDIIRDNDTTNHDYVDMPEFQELIRLFKENSSLIGALRVGVVYSVGSILEKSVERGRTSIQAADILSTREKTQAEGGGIEVVFKDPDGSERTEHYDHVVAALGAETDPRKIDDPLMRNMLEKGMIRPHWTDIGIDVSRDGRVVNAKGEKSDLITAIGVVRSGDTMVRERDFPEKRGTGGRLGPFIQNIPAIIGTLGSTIRRVRTDLFANFEENSQRKLLREIQANHPDLIPEEDDTLELESTQIIPKLEQRSFPADDQFDTHKEFIPRQPKIPL